MKKSFIFLLVLLHIGSYAQSLFVPGGFSSTGIGTSTVSGNVGIGQSSPSEKLEIQSVNPSARLGDTQDVSTFGTSFRELSSIKFYHHYNTLIGAKIYATKEYSSRSWGGTDLRFAVSNVSNNSIADAMTIAYTGNVGIGTTLPQAMLHVNGTTFLGTLGSQFYVSSGSTFFSSQAGIRNNGGDVVFNSQAGGTLYLNRDVIADTRIQSNSTDVAVFLRNGNVGIGTLTPSTKLSVSGGAIMNSDPNYSGINVRLSGSNIPVLNFSRDLNGSQTSYHNASVGQFYNSSAGQYSLGFSTGVSSSGDQNANTLAMTVMLNGNVGIGTSSPDAKLSVSGQVHAQEVKVSVTVPGPDYVFEKDYQLTSLDDIKTYIDQNKHLPEVPSAKEMEKNGVQLGEMNMLLLKKIEELTLYTIEMNKKMEELNKKNMAAELWMKNMQSEISQLKK